MFYHAAEFFGKIKNSDDRLKFTYNYANGLTDVELAKYKSIRGDMLTPEFFVREIIVYPPPGKTKDQIYTELSLHYSLYGHNFFLLLNRSLHLSEPVEYDITLLWQGEGSPIVIDLTSGEAFTPGVPVQGDEFMIHVTQGPGEAGFYIITNSSGGGTERELYLWGEWRNRGIVPWGQMNPQDPSDHGYALCRWEWLKGKPVNLTGMSTWKHPCGEEDWDPGPSDFVLAWNLDLGAFYDAMDADCMNYVKVGEHDDGDNLDDIEIDLVGTKSNVITIQEPEGPEPGCPELYTFVEQDTATCTYSFMENNTILPFSETAVSPEEIRLDLLKIDVLNIHTGHYYFNIRENDDEETYLYGATLWVVDHPEGTIVATSSDSNIYVYSDVAKPLTCVDQSSIDRYEEVVYRDDQAFIGSDNSYLTVSFPNTSWINKGILILTGLPDGIAEIDWSKNYYCLVQKSNGQGGWIPRGEVFARKNPSLWLVDVSDASDTTFRIDCFGDSCCINYVALVKLENNGWTQTEAPIDSAILWIVDPPGTAPVGSNVEDLISDPQTAGIISLCGQLALSFTEVPPDTTCQRDFVLQTSGYYIPGIGGGDGGEQSTTPSLRFDLEVQTLHGLRKAMLISYEVPVVTDVKIAIVDVAGRVVAEPLKEEVAPGRHQLEWNWRDDAGRKVASGVYFVKMVAGEFTEANKVVLIK